MKITLEKVHYMATLSEETACFDAVVCIDGARAFYASNRGNGGPTDLSPLPRQSRDDFQRLLESVEAHAKALPAEDLGSGRTWQPSAEDLVDNALTAWLQRKDVLRLMRTKIVVVQGRKVFTLKPTKKPAEHDDATRERIRAQIAKDCPDGVILNYLPEDEAVALYIKSAEAA